MKRMAAPSRIQAYRCGRRAEIWAALSYRLRGYRIVARRYQCAVGEIDLIVRRGRRLAFVEVKARKDMAGAFGAVGYSSRRRIERAAGLFLAQNERYQGFFMRFDVVGVVLLWNIVPIRFECVDNAWMIGA